MGDNTIFCAEKLLSGQLSLRHKQTTSITIVAPLM